MSKVRIGFVGVGSMGQCAHLQNYCTLDDCEVVALAEIMPGLGREVARKYDVPGVYTSHKDMLDAEDIDALVCVQPFTRHGILLPELYDTGLPVLTEKPLARSVQVGSELIDKLDASGGKHYVAYHKRSDPATMHTRALMDKLAKSQELGPLKYIRVTMPTGDWIAAGFNIRITSDEKPPSLDWDPPAPDMTEQLDNAYVAFVNYYIHQVNLLHHLFGEDYHVSYVDPKGVTMTVHTDSGVTGTLEMSPYSTSIDWQEQALICYERGWIRLDLPAPLAHNRPGKVTVYKEPTDADRKAGADPVEITPTLPWIHAMRQQAMNYVAAVRGETTPLATAADAMKDLNIALEYLNLMHNRAGA